MVAPSIMTATQTTTSAWEQQHTQTDWKKRIKVALKDPQNSACADCGTKRPTWGLIVKSRSTEFPENLGGFVCMECAGGHRSLGTHISVVRSVNLDEWCQADVLTIEQCGNKALNQIYQPDILENPPEDVMNTQDSRQNHCRAKYQDLKWYSAWHHQQHVQRKQQQSSSSGESTTPRTKRTSLLKFLNHSPGKQQQQHNGETKSLFGAFKSPIRRKKEKDVQSTGGLEYRNGNKSFSSKLSADTQTTSELTASTSKTASSASSNPDDGFGAPAIAQDKRRATMSMAPSSTQPTRRNSKIIQRRLSNDLESLPRSNSRRGFLPSPPPSPSAESKGASSVRSFSSNNNARMQMYSSGTRTSRGATAPKRTKSMEASLTKLQSSDFFGTGGNPKEEVAPPATPSTKTKRRSRMPSPRRRPVRGVSPGSLRKPRRSVSPASNSHAGSTTTRPRAPKLSEDGDAEDAQPSSGRHLSPGRFRGRRRVAATGGEESTTTKRSSSKGPIAVHQDPGRSRSTGTSTRTRSSSLGPLEDNTRRPRRSSSRGPLLERKEEVSSSSRRTRSSSSGPLARERTTRKDGTKRRSSSKGPLERTEGRSSRRRSSSQGPLEERTSNARSSRRRGSNNGSVQEPSTRRRNSNASGPHPEGEQRSTTRRRNSNTSVPHVDTDDRSSSRRRTTSASSPRKTEERSTRRRNSNASGPRPVEEPSQATATGEDTFESVFGSFDGGFDTNVQKQDSGFGDGWGSPGTLQEAFDENFTAKKLHDHLETRSLATDFGKEENSQESSRAGGSLDRIRRKKGSSTMPKRRASRGFAATGGSDVYQDSKLRTSKTEQAELKTARNAAKADIFAAMDRELTDEDFMADIPERPPRKAPHRSKSSDEILPMQQKSQWKDKRTAVPKRSLSSVVGRSNLHGSTNTNFSGFSKTSGTSSNSGKNRTVLKPKTPIVKKEPIVTESKPKELAVANDSDTFGENSFDSFNAQGFGFD